jgi:hypothetical protein
VLFLQISARGREEFPPCIEVLWRPRPITDGLQQLGAHLSASKEHATSSRTSTHSIRAQFSEVQPLKIN